MKKAIIYPGSFDPITKGHIDIIKRASKITDRLIVGVFNNFTKKYWFSPEERKELIEKSLSDIDNVEVKVFGGLLVDFMSENDIHIILRGLRSVTDYEYELQLALGNSALSDSGIETIFMPASRDYLHLSSSMVREIAINNGRIRGLVNENIIHKIEDKAVELQNKS